MFARLALLAAVPFAFADDQLTCALDGAGALDSTVNAGVYLWAATQRCGDSKTEIKCEVDVTSALSSVIDMGSIIAKAVATCSGDIQTQHTQCGLAASHLVSVTSGLAGATGSLARWGLKGGGAGDAVGDSTTTQVGNCIIDAKTVMNDIFQVAAAIKAAQAGCGATGGEVCASKALSVISILSDLGAAIAHSLVHCDFHPNADHSDADMGGDIVGFVSTLDGIAQAGIAVHEKCAVSAARLYAVSDLNTGVAQSTNNGFVSMIAFSLIPIAAVIGFVGGKRRKAQINEQIIDQNDLE